jgi:hypothetical protein
MANMSEILDQTQKAATKGRSAISEEPLEQFWLNVAQIRYDGVALSVRTPYNFQTVGFGTGSQSRNNEDNEEQVEPIIAVD